MYLQEHSSTYCFYLKDTNISDTRKAKYFNIKIVFVVLIFTSSNVAIISLSFKSLFRIFCNLMKIHFGFVHTYAITRSFSFVYAFVQLFKRLQALYVEWASIILTTLGISCLIHHFQECGCCWGYVHCTVF